MKSDQICIRVRELRRKYLVLDLIDIVSTRYGKRLCPHTVPRIIADKYNRCEFKHPDGGFECRQLFYAQKPYTKYCPTCRKHYRSEILAISKNLKPKTGRAAKFAEVSSDWLYGRKSNHD